MEEHNLVLPIVGVLRLAELNGISISREKAKEEISEFLVELCSNKSDTMLLDEAADMFITTIQVLKHKGLLEKLPKIFLKKTKKGLKYYQ